MADRQRLDDEYKTMSKDELQRELAALHRKIAAAEDRAAAGEKLYFELFEDSSVCIWDQDWSVLKSMIDELSANGVVDLRAYFKQHPECYFRAFRTITVSRGMVRLYGAPNGEALLERWGNIADDEQMDRAIETAQAFLDGALNLDYEAEERKFDGTSVHTFTKVSLLPERVDDWSRVIISVMNITPRKKAERALQETDAILRAYFDNSPTAISLKDTRGRFVRINRKFEKALGKTSDEVKGKTTHDLYPQVAADTIVAHEREVMKTGDTVEWDQELSDEQGVETWRLSKFPIRDMDGKILSIGSVATNITDNLIAEKAAIVSESRLAAFVNHSPDAISLKDIAGRYRHMNPAAEAIVGRALDDIIGLRSHDLFEKDVADIGVAQDRDVIETGQPVQNEQKITVRGRSYIFLTLKFPLRDAQGAMNGIGAISTDITERKEVERLTGEALHTAEMANRTKSEFLANMSHELRTPLNAIIGFSEIMNGEMLGPIGSPKYIEYARDINTAGSHLMDLINDILDISKVESGTVELFEERVDIAGALESCLTMVRQRAAQGKVAINVETASNLPHMFADERKLKQIIINLLSNAIKFTPAGGTVTVRAWSSPRDGYVFQIEDTGIGISLSDIPRALAPFQQIDSALNRKFDGTGLGLPLTKALAELHGGSLGLDSEVGVGTTVTVRIPKERVMMISRHGAA